MKFIDTHSHIFLPEFDSDRPAAMQRAIDAGLDKIILPNVDVETIDPLLNLCSEFPTVCIPAMGLHPGSVDENYKLNLTTIENEIRTNDICAIGEIGIDLYWDKTFKEQQIEVFEKQIIWAKELNLPIIIHLRNSYNEVIEVVKRNQDGNLTGVFHCFTGNETQGNEIIDLGFYLGIGGILTFKNSGLDKAIKNLPLDKLLLETDSPYLAPTPYRGKRNESAYVVNIAKKLAEIKNLHLNEIGEITSKNARKIFPIN